MSSIAADTYITPETYLALERKAKAISEYVPRRCPRNVWGK